MTRECYIDSDNTKNHGFYEETLVIIKEAGRLIGG